MPLPTFKYHPDPLATGSIIESPTICLCCHKPRGYIYTGPVYSEHELIDALCPFCIADGSAHEKFDAAFTDECGIGGYGEWDDVPDSVIAEVAHRTPGFNAWQQEHWWTHCHDAAQFLGPVGKTELESLGPAALAAIQQSADLFGPDWQDLLLSLHKNHPPTAYLFRCTQCHQLGGYHDSD